MFSNYFIHREDRTLEKVRMLNLPAIEKRKKILCKYMLYHTGPNYCTAFFLQKKEFFP